MLPLSIIEKIRLKYGVDTLYSRDCAVIAREINSSYRAPQISETTIKRLLGFIGADSPDRHRTPRQATLDVIARWIGYNTYSEMIAEIGESETSSDFSNFEGISASNLPVGANIKIKYSPLRMIVLSYLGNSYFIVTESEKSKLKKGDILKITNLVLGQELIVMDVIRENQSLGGYRAAKDGGLTSIELTSPM